MILACACAQGATQRPSPAAAAKPAAPVVVRERRGYTTADVGFMQRMIGHHAQALAMTSLVPARTTRPEIRMIAERIAVSQRDEIALMARWLANHGETVPDTSGAHASHGSAMAGMLSSTGMERLAALSGAAFDRQFLNSMIRHHQGALAMVAELLGSRGAGQDPAVFSLAADVDADQRAEIGRMRAVLATLPDER